MRRCARAKRKEGGDDWAVSWGSCGGVKERHLHACLQIGGAVCGWILDVLWHFQVFWIMVAKNVRRYILSYIKHYHIVKI